VLLKYLHHKQYLFAFRAGILATLLVFFQSILAYIILIFVARELQVYSMIIVVVFLITAIVFALALIFSGAGEKPWLKTAGIFMLILYVVFGVALAWGTIPPGFLTAGTLQKIEQWVSLAGSIIPLFFIMDFVSELKFPSVTAEEPHRHGLKEQVSIGALIITVVVVITLGVKITRDSYWALDWNKKGPARAQELARAFERRIHVNGQGDTLRYLLMRPLDYDSSARYPLVVCLHGGPVPKRNRELQVEVPEPAPILSEYKNRKEFPAFIFVPQGPPGFTWGGIPHLPAVDSLVFETIDELENEFTIDVKRRYVAGGSMGGYGAWYFIGTRPEMFAAAIPFCGAGNIDLAQNMVDIPIWAFHGDVDRNVAVSGSRKMIEAIKKAGGDPRYTEFADVGHNVWPSIIETPGVLDWLFAQKRK